MSLFRSARSDNYWDQKYVIDNLSNLGQQDRWRLLDVLADSPYTLIKYSLLRASVEEPIEIKFKLAKKLYQSELYFAMPDYLSLFADHPDYSNKALSMLRNLKEYPSNIVRVRVAHVLRFFVHDGAEAVLDLFHILSSVARDAPRSLLAGECVYSIIRLALSIKSRKDLAIDDDLRKSTFNTIRNYLSLVLRDYPELAEGRMVDLLEICDYSKSVKVVPVYFHRLDKHNLIQNSPSRIIFYRK